MIDFDTWWNSAAADEFRTQHENADGSEFRSIWKAAVKATMKQAEPNKCSTPHDCDENGCSGSCLLHEVTPCVQAGARPVAWAMTYSSGAPYNFWLTEEECDEAVARVGGSARKMPLYTYSVEATASVAEPGADERAAKSISDEMMDLVDRLGSEFDEVDPQAWEHLLIYAPKPMKMDVVSAPIEMNNWHGRHAYAAGWNDCREARKNLAAQSCQRAGVAEGWKLVPIEPTDAMLSASQKTAEEAGVFASLNNLCAIWCEMLAAASTQQQESGK